MPRVLVIGAKRTKYTSKKTGQLVDFATVSLVMGDIRNTAEERGCEVLTMDAPIDVFNRMDVLPGFYDVEFGVKRGWNNENEPVLYSALFVDAMRLDHDGVMTVVKSK